MLAAKRFGECAEDICGLDAIRVPYPTSYRYRTTVTTRVYRRIRESICISRFTYPAKQKLLFAKCRLCPLQGLSTQKLELLATVISVQPVRLVAQRLDLLNIPKYLWSDSRCALAWKCQRNEHKLPRFVRKRVQEIQKDSALTFAYIKSTDKADIATRDITIQGLKNNDFRLKGSDWPQQERSKWLQGVQNGSCESGNTEDKHI